MEEKKVNAEIEEMLNAMGDPTPEALVEEGEDDNEEEKSEEKKEEEEEEEKSEEKKEEEKPEEKSEEGDEEKEEDEGDDKDKIIENLRNRLNEKVDVKTPDKKEETPPDKKEEKKEDPLKFEDQDFIGDLDLDDLTRDKTAFNKILNAVYSKGVNDSKRIATEGVLNSIPDIVKHNLTLLTNLKEMSDNFYNENKDLVPFKRVVAAVFEEVAAQNPDKNYSDLMILVGPEARKRLELHKQAIKEEKGNGDEGEDGKIPRLHGVKGGLHRAPSNKPNTSALEKEISEMNKTLGIRR